MHFASLIDLCHLKNAELEAKHQNTKIEFHFEETLRKMFLDFLQCSLNNDHQHHK